jgi:hypothetical protein
VFVVGQAFAELDVGNGVQRWHSAERHGHRVFTRVDSTMRLLALAEEAVGEGLTDFLAGRGIAALEISRWQLMSAPPPDRALATCRARLRRFDDAEPRLVSRSAGTFASRRARRAPPACAP